MAAARPDGEGIAAKLSELLKGWVITGVGVAAGFTELPWALTQFQSKLGFKPFPGTLNVRLSPEYVVTWEKIRSGARIEITPQPGSCVSYAFPMVVNEAVPGAALWPEVPGYPNDVVEVLAELHVRSALGLADGDPVEMLFG